MTLTRRHMLQGAAAAATAATLGAPLRAFAQGKAEFTYKYANNLPVSHPMNLRAKEMADAIRAETHGRVDIQIFPNNQLGSDTDVLSQLRSGGVEFFTLSGLILSTLVPAASISGVGFAFKDYDSVWKAMDGDLGAYIRAQIAKANIVPMDRIWDNGFRQITSSTKPIAAPADLKGFKIRVPVSPLWTSMFKALDAAPTSINFAEVYSALQTKIVRRPGEPAGHHCHRQTVRGAEVLLAQQPHVGRLLVPGQQAGVGEAARRPARHRGQAHQRRRGEGARRRGGAQRQPAEGPGRQGHGLQPARRQRLPRAAAQGRLLQRVEGQVR
jgi:tripartite ATP-independent transporter DctP family solute receptor